MRWRKNVAINVTMKFCGAWRAIAQTGEMHCCARTSRSAQERNLGGTRGDRSREGEEEEEEEEQKTGQEREKGAGTREGEKKSRTLNRPLALGLRIKRYDRRGGRIGERKRGEASRMSRGMEQDDRKRRIRRDEDAWGDSGETRGGGGAGGAKRESEKEEAVVPGLFHRGRTYVRIILVIHVIRIIPVIPV